MHLLAFGKHDIFHIGDASEYSIGGFDFTGRAWQYLTPTG